MNPCTVDLWGEVLTKYLLQSCFLGIDVISAAVYIYITHPIRLYKRCKLGLAHLRIARSEHGRSIDCGRLRRDLCVSLHRCRVGRHRAGHGAYGLPSDHQELHRG